MTGGNQARTPGSDPLSVALLALFPLPLPGRKTGTPSRTHRPMADPEPSGVFFFRIAGTVSGKDRWFVRREISRLRIIHGQPKYLRNKTRNSAVGYCECSLPGTHPPPLPGRTRHPQAGTLARRPSPEPLGIFLSAGRARSTSFRVPGRSPPLPVVPDQPQAGPESMQRSVVGCGVTVDFLHRSGTGSKFICECRNFPGTPWSDFANDISCRSSASLPGRKHRFPQAGTVPTISPRTVGTFFAWISPKCVTG